jgi:hypothetical protein
MSNEEELSEEELANIARNSKNQLISHLKANKNEIIANGGTYKFQKKSWLFKHWSRFKINVKYYFFLTLSKIFKT